MNKQILALFTAAILVQVSGFRETYKAAVVEYHPSRGSTDEATAEANVQKYTELMKEAKKKGAQIIVFPESGLLTKTPSPIPSPAEGISPCKDEFATTTFVKNLSCASKNNSIYSVVNLPEKEKCQPSDSNCPNSGFYTYNTNVVFDRNGKVIARYRKYNLVGETNKFDKPEEPEISFFDTDFDVRFGTIISYDLIFGAPGQDLVRQYGITDFVCPTQWFSELPFLTALQGQRGWAESNNVNLLAAGLNDLTAGSTGSGIYNGKYGRIAEVSLEEGISKLLVADVPKIPDAVNLEPSPSALASSSSGSPTTAEAVPETGFQLRQDDMKLYTSEVIDGETFKKTICRYDFCCDFTVTKDSLKPESKKYSVRAVVSNGVRYFDNKFRGGVQSCGVVVCNGPDIFNCTSRMTDVKGLFRFKEIAIKGDFHGRNSFQMPSTLTDGKELKPLPANKYEFNRRKSNKSAEVTLELLWPVTDLRTFGIWGRNFVRDMEEEYPVSKSSAIFSKLALFGASVAFFLFFR